jgi:hypothetical protein
MEQLDLPSGSLRLGLGEFADPRGLLPRLMAHDRYLAALFEECEESFFELARIWSPMRGAMLDLLREGEARAVAGHSPAGPTADPAAVEALLVPLCERLNLSLPDILGQTAVWDTRRFAQPPDDDPAMLAVVQTLGPTLRRHAAWMNRYGLPTDDLGWCFTTIGIVVWAACFLDWSPSLWAVAELPAAVPIGTPRLALEDAERMKQLLDRAAAWIKRFNAVMPRSGDVADGFLARQLVEETLDTIFGPAVPVALPRPIPWNPVLETEAAAKARLLAEAERAITTQLAAARAQFTSSGAQPAPIKPSGLDHFRWLVRYQVHRQSMRAIARSVCKERQTVRTAIAETAALLGLRLRDPSPGGRPRRERRAAA